MCMHVVDPFGIYVEINTSNVYVVGPIDIYMETNVSLDEWTGLLDEMLGLVLQQQTHFKLKITKIAVNNFHIRQAKQLRWLLSITDKQVCSGPSHRSHNMCKTSYKVDLKVKHCFPPDGTDLYHPLTCACHTDHADKTQMCTSGMRPAIITPEDSDRGLLWDIVFSQCYLIHFFWMGGGEGGGIRTTKLSAVRNPAVGLHNGRYITQIWNIQHPEHTGYQLPLRLYIPFS